MLLAVSRNSWNLWESETKQPFLSSSAAKLRGNSSNGNSIGGGAGGDGGGGGGGSSGGDGGGSSSSSSSSSTVAIVAATAATAAAMVAATSKTLAQGTGELLRRLSCLLACSTGLGGGGNNRNVEFEGTGDPSGDKSEVCRGRIDSNNTAVKAQGPPAWRSSRGVEESAESGCSEGG
ncbi:hypothetical protein HZH66_002720 [Vespula vulgaris]|uniref:Uncharacterized protein n=1 Tax=Vespula vulgaris TaxID=7454 RepID=A0A834NI10_VESVU|nr:hypothetical protein HZH66_002720 [Vespula vulgaris]